MKELIHAILTQLGIYDFYVNLELMHCFQMRSFPTYTEQNLLTYSAVIIL